MIIRTSFSSHQFTASGIIMYLGTRSKKITSESHLTTFEARNILWSGQRTLARWDSDEKIVSSFVKIVIQFKLSKFIICNFLQAIKSKTFAYITF
jgi:hypothetical protein